MVNRMITLPTWSTTECVQRLLPSQDAASYTWVPISCELALYVPSFRAHTNTTGNVTLLLIDSAATRTLWLARGTFPS